MPDKKISFLVSSISLSGGTERVCIAIANKLALMGYSVSIISMYGGKPFFELNEAVKAISLYEDKVNFKLRIPITLMRLRRVLVQTKINILVSVDAALFAYSFSATIGIKLSHVVWEHFNLNASSGSKLRVFSRRLGAKYADEIITLTQRDKMEWIKRYNPNNITAINNPTLFNSIDFDSSWELRDKIILSVGRLTRQKGFDRLLDAYKLASRQIPPDWNLNIVGSGEEFELLKLQISKLGLEDRVMLIPVTNQISAHYRKASIYCMSSRYEGFPMVLLEAQSFGLPLISFDCETGPAEIISDSRNGFLVPDGDIVGMSNAIVRLVNDSNLRKKIGYEASMNSNAYGIDVIIKSWEYLIGKHGNF